MYNFEQRLNDSTAVQESGSCFLNLLTTSCEFAVNEGQDLASVLVGILLVGIGIISGTAVWISRVTIALDDARILSALISYGPSRELMCKLLASAPKVRENWKTYTLSGTSTDIVREAMNKGRGAHENHSFDGFVCRLSLIHI